MSDLRTYRGFTLDRVHGSGYWRGIGMVDRHLVTLMADTLDGLRGVIRVKLGVRPWNTPNRADGRVSAYGFMCGYVEVYGDWLADDGVRLYAEPDHYAVRGMANGVRVWETFERVADARRFARTFGPWRPEGQ